MSTFTLQSPRTLLAALAPRLSIPRQVVIAILGSLALWLSAKAQIPFYPVPMTMQTFVVLVIGIAFGAKLGVATVALYLLEGALGLPVFAGTPEKGIGLPYMLGPTGGYLAGFLIAAGLMGWLAERGLARTWLSVAAVMALGHALILALGVAWLAKFVGLDKAVAVGLTPFWAATFFKTALAMVAVPFVWTWVKRR